jgi:hypothetical protein
MLDASLPRVQGHEEDVAGRVMEQIEREEIKGRVISIPAIAGENDPLGREPGEYLWDDPGGVRLRCLPEGATARDQPMMWAVAWLLKGYTSQAMLLGALSSNGSC